MTPTEFEVMTQKLLSERLKTEFNYTISVDHKRIFTSNTGNKYEIDLSYSFVLFNISYLTLVECKYWNSYVTREKVGYFKSIMDDLKAQKGIVVTTHGFQTGAVEYAKSQNIGLIKITNDKYFETHSHFDGGINVIQEHLLREDFLNERESHVSIGMFFPTCDALNFIGEHYGQALVNYLEHEFNPYDLDNPNFTLNPIVKEQLLNIPDNWYEGYYLTETAGLHYKTINEPAVRIINVSIYALKVVTQGFRG